MWMIKKEISTVSCKDYDWKKNNIQEQRSDQDNLSRVSKKDLLTKLMI